MINDKIDSMSKIRNNFGRFIKNHPGLLKKKGIYIKCETCNKKIYRTKSLLKYKHNFCSWKCRDIHLTKLKKEKSVNWKGGRRLAASGYIMIFKPEHPYSCYGYVREHRLVMEKKLKRYLKTNEIIHHKNGIKTDNRIKNLEIISRGKHNTIHRSGDNHWKRRKNKNIIHNKKSSSETLSKNPLFFSGCR